MMDIREKITETEMTDMHIYRDMYAYKNDPNCDPISIFNLLEVWKDEKQDLYKLFGGNLILSKQIEYNESVEQIAKKISAAMRKSASALSTFRKRYLSLVDELYPNPYNFVWGSVEMENAFETENIRCGLYNLMEQENLAGNKFIDETFTIKLPNGKDYTIRQGMKVMKALAKISEVYCLEGFEEFRLEHSLILNQKTIKGELCLSIHPFDYWTMSDNTSNWESCMSWTNMGCYRIGTVEMMNSSIVIVAYIKPEEDMELGCNITWNNKRWRKLYIVSKDCITGVKDYPYANEHIDTEVMNWLKELAETNMGWKYYNNEAIEQHKFLEQVSRLHFETELMYNDISRANKSTIYYSEEIEKIMNNGEHYHVNFSGPCQCVNCGSITTNIEGYDNGELICYDCGGGNYDTCENCGQRYCEEDMYYLNDGSVLCPDCFENHTTRCEYCDEAYATFEDRTRFNVLFVNSTEELEALSDEDIKKYAKEVCSDCYYRYNSFHYNKTIENAGDDYYRIAVGYEFINGIMDRTENPYRLERVRSFVNHALINREELE